MAVSATPILEPGDASPLFSGGSYMEMFAVLTFTGSYTVGGDVLDFLPLFGGLASQVITVLIAGGAGNQFEYDKANKKVKGFSAANTELTAAAYNAAITGDTNIIARIVAK